MQCSKFRNMGEEWTQRNLKKQKSTSFSFYFFLVKAQCLAGRKYQERRVRGVHVSQKAGRKLHLRQFRPLHSCSLSGTDICSVQMLFAGLELLQLMFRRSSRLLLSYMNVQGNVRMFHMHGRCVLKSKYLH